MRSSEKTAIAASFVIISAPGAWLLYRYWAVQGLAGAGLLRGLAFVGIMGAVHLAALRLYRGQGKAIAAAGFDGADLIAGGDQVPSHPAAGKVAHAYAPALERLTLALRMGPVRGASQNQPEACAMQA